MENTLEDFVPTEKEGKNPYEPFYLERNPFPHLQILYEGKFIEFEEFSKKTRDVLGQFYRDGRTNRLVIMGDNRSGKTHALLYIGYIINNYIFPQYRYLKAIYIRRPPDIKGGEKGTFYDTYREMMESEGFGKVFFDDLVDKLSELAPTRTGKYMGQTFSDIDGFLKKHNISDGCSTCLDIWKNNKEIKDLAWDWICGRKLTSKELTKLQVSKNIESSSHAIFMLSEIIKCCRLAFHENFGFCLFIDEFEELAKLSKRDKIRYLADIRNLIDGVPEGLILVFGMASYGWKILEDYQALKIRLRESMIELKKINDKNDALLYVREYLRWGREKYCVKCGKTLQEIKEEIMKNNEDADYFPFTRQETIEIFEEGNGEVDIELPGNFLELLSKKIEAKIRK